MLHFKSVSCQLTDNASAVSPLKNREHQLFSCIANPATPSTARQVPESDSATRKQRCLDPVEYTRGRCFWPLWNDRNATDCIYRGIRRCFFGRSCSDLRSSSLASPVPRNIWCEDASEDNSGFLRSASRAASWIKSALVPAIRKARFRARVWSV